MSFSVFGIDLGKAFQSEWIAVPLTLLLLVTALLRLLTVLIQTAEAAGLLKQATGTNVGALVSTLAAPGRKQQELAARGRVWAGVLHPFGLGLALCSAGVASLIGIVPDLDQWSGRAPWVLAAGLIGSVACIGVVWLWPASPAGLRRLRRARNRVARQLSTRIRSSSGGARAELERLGSAALARIDHEIVPALAQLVRRDAEVMSEILVYERSSPEPNGDVVARLQAIHAQLELGTQACAQWARDAEARLFVLLRESGDLVLVAGLGTWVDDLGQLIAALTAALTMSPWAAPPLQHKPAEPLPEDFLVVAVEPPPPDFVDLTRRALRALNRPSILVRSGLIPLLRLSIDDVWHRSGEPRLIGQSPLEQGQALRTILVAAVEQLNVSEDGGMQAHQYQVLRMQYVMGLTVVQVAMRLSIAEKTAFRRNKEGAEAVANDIWRREQLLNGRVRSMRDDVLAAQP